MKMTIEPTEEIYDVPINGVDMPLRLWKGRTSKGIKVEAYVLAIVPMEDKDYEKFSKELPSFMGKARDAFDIGTEEQRKEWDKEREDDK